MSRDLPPALGRTRYDGGYTGRLQDRAEGLDGLTSLLDREEVADGFAQMNDELRGAVFRLVSWLARDVHELSLVVMAENFALRRMASAAGVAVPFDDDGNVVVPPEPDQERPTE